MPVNPLGWHPENGVCFRISIQPERADCFQDDYTSISDCFNYATKLKKRRIMDQLSFPVLIIAGRSLLQGSERQPYVVV